MKLDKLKQIIKEEISKLENQQPLNEDMGACAQMFASGPFPGGYNPLPWRTGFAITLAKIYSGAGGEGVPEDITSQPYFNFPPTSTIVNYPNAQAKACQFLDKRINTWSGKIAQGVGPKQKNMLTDRIGLANCMKMNAFYC